MSDEELLPQENESFAELSAISDLYKRAVHEGVLVECIWSFGQARANGCNVFEAVRFAMREWDV